MSAEALCKRKDKAKAYQMQWRDLLEDAYDHIVPARNNFTQKVDGNEENDHIYDETAALAIPRFASRMQRSLFPEGIEWVQFKTGSDVPEDGRDQLDQALEKYTEHFFTHINQSNFYTEINPAFIDCGISTGCIQIDEEPFGSDKMFRFSCVSVDEVYLEAPYKGELCNLWRCFKLPAEQIPKIWPKAKIPAKLQKLIKDAPQDDQEISLGQIKEGDQYKIYVLWTKELLLEEVFNTQRIIPFRLYAFPKERYGRGPGIVVLPAIRDANILQKLQTESAAINVAGMYTAIPDSVFNPYTFEVTSGGIVPVASNSDQNPTLKRLPPAGEPSYSMTDLEIKRDIIRKAFFVDPMGDISDPVRSATEQTMRMQEFLKDQGAGISRLRTELVNKVVLACVDILTSRGKLPGEIKVDGKEVKISHNTVLVQAEKQDDYQALITLTQYFAGSFGPESLPAMLNVSKLPSKVADMLGVSQELVLSEAEQMEMAQKAAEVASAAVQDPQ